MAHHDDEHIPPGVDLLMQGHVDPSYRGLGHENQDTKVSGVLYFAVGLTLVTILIHLGLGAWLMAFRGEESRQIAERPPMFNDMTGLYPGPRLSDNPARDMANQTVKELNQLNSYGWADPGKVARVPIDRAIALVVERGLPRPMAPRGPAPVAEPASEPVSK